MHCCAAAVGGGLGYGVAVGAPSFNGAATAAGLRRLPEGRRREDRRRRGECNDHGEHAECAEGRHRGGGGVQ